MPAKRPARKLPRRPSPRPRAIGLSPGEELIIGLPPKGAWKPNQKVVRLAPGQAIQLIGLSNEESGAEQAKRRKSRKGG